MSIVEDTSERMRVSSALGGGRSVPANELPDSYLDSYLERRNHARGSKRTGFSVLT